MEKEHLSFPLLVYQVLNVVKALTFAFGVLLAILNRHILIDTYSSYERQVLATLGTILKKNFLKENNKMHSGEQHYVKMHGLLSYDNMLFMFILAFTAVFC